MIDVGYGILPEEILFGDFRPEIPIFRPHVSMNKLEPCPGEGVLKLVRVVPEMLGQFPEVRIAFQCHIRREHHRRDLFPFVVGMWNGILRLFVLRRPLMSTGRTCGELPVVL